MSQHDFNIANQTASNARADINNALSALASLSSGSTAPSTTYANMLWYDTGTNLLKMRTEADDAWISIAYLDQTANAFRILDNTQVTNTSGTQTGLLGDQTQATWETGTGTTESLVSPAKIKAAIDALGISAGDLAFGTEFVQVITPTASADLDVSLPDSSKFSSVTIEFHNISSSSSPGSEGGHELFMRFSKDGGSTFLQGSSSYAGSSVETYSGTKYAIRLTDVQTNTANRGICGVVKVYDYDSSTRQPRATGDLLSENELGTLSRSLEFARVNSVGAYNLIRFNFRDDEPFRSGQGRIIVRGHRKN